MPSPIAVALASLARDAGVDEIAFATLEAAIVAAEIAVEAPLAPPAAAGKVEDEERTVIRGVDVTPVFSVARRKLGIERAGCGLETLIPVADPFNRGVEPSLDETVAEAVELAVPGRCVLACCIAAGCVLSEVRIVIESWVLALLLDAVESAGLYRPLDSDARLLVESVDLRMGVPAKRGESLEAGVVDKGRPFAPMRGVI